MHSHVDGWNQKIVWFPARHVKHGGIMTVFLLRKVNINIEEIIISEVKK